MIATPLPLPAGAAAKLFIGPAGWSYADWNGRVYPAETPRGFDRLAYLADHFDVVEINSSFYRPPPGAWTRAWAERVEANPRFRFTAKLWRRFTHQRETPPTPADVGAVREGLDGLAERDRLLAVLVQFPWSYRNGPGERRWLAAIQRAFAAYPLALEVRHASWDSPDAIVWLREREIALAVIDQPRHEGSLGPVEHRTGPVVYYRFHGRNHAAWFAEGRPSHERYDYLYSRAELAPWVERLRAAAADTAVQAVIAITNNHYQGKAVVNALQLVAWATQAPVAIPRAVRETWSEAVGDLPAVTGREPGDDQSELFPPGPA
ncbi:MAG: DUF72 domain-containing protein [Gemmatimonadota bacterium]